MWTPCPLNEEPVPGTDLKEKKQKEIYQQQIRIKEETVVKEAVPYQGKSGSDTRGKGEWTRMGRKTRGTPASFPGGRTFADSGLRKEEKRGRSFHSRIKGCLIFSPEEGRSEGQRGNGEKGEISRPTNYSKEKYSATISNRRTERGGGNQIEPKNFFGSAAGRRGVFGF